MATGKIPAWFVHVVSSCDLRVSAACLLLWSRACWCYQPLVVLKGEMSKNLRALNAIRRTFANREDISLASE